MRPQWHSRRAPAQARWADARLRDWGDVAGRIGIAAGLFALLWMGGRWLWAMVG